MRILAEESLVLVIDVQEKLLPVMSNPTELTKNIQALIQGLAIAKVPTIVTEQYPKGLGATVPEILSEGQQLSFMEKKEFSCYDNEVIRLTIQSSGCKNVILCGIEAHICVLQTLIDLRAAGYNVILVEDCIRSRKMHDQQIALHRAQYEGAIVTTLESLLFELVRWSGTPAFKQLSTLVKSI